MLPGFHHKLEQQQAPAFFARGPSPLARLVFFSALSLVLIATDSRLQYLTGLRQNLVALLQPLEVLANAPSQLYRDINEYFSTHNYLLAENQRLNQQALKQDIALQRLNLLMLENTNLRNLLQANKTMVESSLLGEIMHVSRDPFTKKIIVNRGQRNQIVTGAAVVDATGVIGQVTRVYPLSSEVTLITDKSLAIPVQVERNGLRAIAFGNGRNNTLDLPYLPANVDIRSGDKLVTSGIDGIYPAGLAVASITKIETSPSSPFAHIICTPTGGIENHRQVLLVSIPNNDTLSPNATIPHAEKGQTKTERSAKGPQKASENTPVKHLPTNTSKPHAPE
ncbi:cell shape-determining protein MreC [mine drainage metagenome]|uniref:Cell shape-determining protein MreC n=1 Tax=mine drainage metagenome TaxID=410659 RepID=A0A1J5S9B0_9ZZZZ